MRILVAGLPRGGTTWFSRVVASAPGVQYIHEPDNRETEPYAAICMPRLRFQDPIPAKTRLPAYELLWDVAFAGGWPRRPVGVRARRLAMHPKLPGPIAVLSSTAFARIIRHRRPPTEHQLVKTVRALGTIEWIADRYSPKVIVVWRSPLNVLGGFGERGWTTSAGGLVRRRFEGTAAGSPPDDPDGNFIWTLCARLGLLLDTAARHPDWLVVRHEETTQDPAARFRDIFRSIELPWAPEVDAFLESSNVAGTGWETKRVASQEATRWKERLSQAQTDTARDVLARFSELAVVGPVFARCLAEMD